MITEILTLALIVICIPACLYGLSKKRTQIEIDFETYMVDNYKERELAIANALLEWKENQLKHEIMAAYYKKYNRFNFRVWKYDSFSDKLIEENKIRTEIILNHLQVMSAFYAPLNYSKEEK